MYYIVEDNDENISYDFLTIIKKINKGEVTSDTMIYTDDNKEPVAAGTVEELASHFEEIDAASELGGNVNFSLRYFAKNGIAFVIENIMTVTVAAGVCLLATVLLFALGAYSPIKEPGFIFAGGISYIFLGAFAYYIIQKNHGRAVDITQMMNDLKAVALHLLVIGLLISIPLVLVAFLLGLFIDNNITIAFITALVLYAELFLTSFVPFLVVDNKMEFIDALKASYQKVMNLQKDDIIMLATLNAAIVIGGLAIMLPLLFILPAVYSAFAEAYEALFSKEDSF